MLNSIVSNAVEKPNMKQAGNQKNQTFLTPNVSLVIQEKEDARKIIPSLILLFLGVFFRRIKSQKEKAFPHRS